jgi:dihydroxyacetone kinase-like predicted kinase
VKKDTSIEEALDLCSRKPKPRLAHTPDLLPILKEVGVVDSGGAGLCVVLEGMLKAPMANSSNGTRTRPKKRSDHQCLKHNTPAPSFPKTKKAMAIAPNSFSV